MPCCFTSNKSLHAYQPLNASLTPKKIITEQWGMTTTHRWESPACRVWGITLKDLAVSRLLIIYYQIGEITPTIGPDSHDAGDLQLVSPLCSLIQTSPFHLTITNNMYVHKKPNHATALSFIEVLMYVKHCEYMHLDIFNGHWTRHHHCNVLSSIVKFIRKFKWSNLRL